MDPAERRDCARRRRALMRLMGPDSLALIPAARTVFRNRDVAYPFRQDSDFAYLTGFPEPDAFAVLAPGRREGAFLLFCRARDREQELWHGRRIGPEGARRDYGADEAFPLAELETVVLRLLEGARTLYYGFGRQEENDRRLFGWIERLRERARAGVRPPAEIRDLAEPLHELRLTKSAHEIALMTHAARLSVEAHRRALAVTAPGVSERTIAAEVRAVFDRAGACEAYATIAGGGDNACILHYTDNADPLRAGTCLLLDAGAEWRGYAADITTTFPVDGRFTPAARAVYEIVHEAQRKAIACARVGRSWNEPHETTVRVITAGLVRLGILRGKPADLVRQEAYRPYYMHRAGHWLGRDVHDVGAYKVDGAWREFEPGMVLTVEPGLYFPAHDRRIPRPFRGLGVRIEDDVLVTATGPRVLTAGLPRTPDEIEAVMGAG
jgi:Xaa-Pro aminopeptidase